jgi:MYXO-CTERM domain-containing protein
MLVRSLSPLLAVALVAFGILAFGSVAGAQTCYVRPPFRIGDTWHCTSACGRSTPHAGVDFPAATGSGVPAIADGVAIHVPFSSCLGNVLVIRHTDGMYSGYSHLSAIHVANGANVSRGQIVAAVGNTGTCTTGPHLHLTLGDHLESYYDRSNVDPLAYIDGHTVCSCDRTNGHFTFSCDGQNAGAHCVSVNEPEDPDSWADNYLCTAADEGVVWSASGPVPSMHCATLSESADAHAATWVDNHVCVPSDAPYELRWSGAGPIAGWSCVHFNEPADPGTWNDNFLCERGVSCFRAGGFTFCAAGAPEGESCVSVNEPGDPDTWSDNFFCASEAAGGAAVGLVWSIAGPVEGMDCTNVVEPSDPHAAAWTDNYLCVPPDSDYSFSWSNAGPIEGRDCVRWYEAADLAGTWNDNYLCVERVVRQPDAGPPIDAGSIRGDDASSSRADGGARDAGPRTPSRISSGCSCRAAGRGPSSGAALLLLVLAALVRRRA